MMDGPVASDVAKAMPRAVLHAVIYVAILVEQRAGPSSK